MSLSSVWHRFSTKVLEKSSHSSDFQLVLILVACAKERIISDPLFRHLNFTFPVVAFDFNMPLVDKPTLSRYRCNHTVSLHVRPR